MDGRFKLLSAPPGDPAWQAEWELLTISVASDMRVVHIHGKCAAVIQTDATAALFNSKRLSGKTAAMNSIAAPIFLRLEAHDIIITPEHMPYVLNVDSDPLSRLSQGPQISRETAVFARDRIAFFLWTWPKDIDTTAWRAAAPPRDTGQGAFRQVREQPFANLDSARRTAELNAIAPQHSRVLPCGRR